MGLKVVGAGLGRTGTHSLKLALEQLLGGRCYHMLETFEHPDDIPVWQRAVEGDLPDWTQFLGEYVATVDWPCAAFWQEISASSPEAVVLLSTRDADGWWESARRTIFDILRRGAPDDSPVATAQLRMANDMLRLRFTPEWTDESAAMQAYEHHNARVRQLVNPSRLVEWSPGDGWGPLCAALEVPTPEDPFPHVNTTADFRAMTGLDG